MIKLNLKTVILMIMTVFMFSCSSSDDDDVTESFTYSEILGTWESTSFLCSGGYFIPVEDNAKDTFVFNKDKTYTYNNNEHGTFSYNNTTHCIWCKDSRGWDMMINVSFTDADKATFDIKGKTETQSMIIKVKRIK